MATPIRPLPRDRATSAVTRAIGAALIVLLGWPLSAPAACHGMVLHAHRGSAAAPENSLSAVRLAFEGDWDGAEIDIQQLRDRTWVVHHDLDATRTTSLQGRNVRQVDAATWREVRLRDRNGQITGEAPAFLSDLLDHVPEREGRVLNIEIKQVFDSCATANDAVARIGKGRPGGQWFLTSIDVRHLRCVRRADPKGYVGVILIDPQALARQDPRGARVVQRLQPPKVDGPWMDSLLRDITPPVGLHVDINTLQANPALLNDAKARSMPVFTYHLGSDMDHARVLRETAQRTGLLPSGAIIDGAPGPFCARIQQP